MISNIYKALLKEQMFEAENADNASLFQYLFGISSYFDRPDPNSDIELSATGASGCVYDFKVNTLEGSGEKFLSFSIADPRTDKTYNTIFDSAMKYDAEGTLDSPKLSFYPMDGGCIWDGFSLDAVIDDVYSGQNIHDIVADINRQFLSSPSVSVANILSVMDVSSNYGNADVAKLKTLVLSTGQSGQITQTSWLTAVEELYRPVEDATGGDDPTTLLDDTKPFVVQSVIGLALSTIVSAVGAACSLIFSLISPVLGIVFSAITAIIQPFLSAAKNATEIEVNGDSSSYYVNGPIRAYSFTSDTPPLGEDYPDDAIMNLTHGPFDTFFWGNRRSKTYCVNTFISPCFSMKSCAEVWTNNNNFNHVVFGQSQGVLWFQANDMGFPRPDLEHVDSYKDTSPLTVQEFDYIKNNPVVAAKMLRLALIFTGMANISTIDIEWNAPQKDFGWAIPLKPTTSGNLESRADIIAWMNGTKFTGSGDDGMLKQIVFLAQALHLVAIGKVSSDVFSPLNLTDIGSQDYPASFVLEAYDRFILPYQNYSGGAFNAVETQYSDDIGGGFSCAVDPFKVPFVDRDSFTIVNGSAVPVKAGLVQVDTIPSDRTFQLPNTTKSSLFGALALAATAAITVAVATYFVGRKMKRKSQQKQMTQQRELKKKYDQFQSSGSTADRDAYLKASRKYNLKAKFLGWSSYDVQNGWASSDSPSLITSGNDSDISFKDLKRMISG